MGAPAPLLRHKDRQLLCQPSPACVLASFCFGNDAAGYEVIKHFCFSRPFRAMEFNNISCAKTKQHLVRGRSAHL
ncbi:hypothetical protein DV515_00001333 [Chloebia gouldiae]|uniref:Uncharacterized protein n=1 Tax=Chloebia gouldiae TaxID=44316 RepID=A0A3L8SYA8_CHLGU|nr:hypothetical protein DV515_00001333 [Chloebia gouldiae]